MNPICPICQESLDSNITPIDQSITWETAGIRNDATPTATKCNHVFCNSCLHGWIETYRERTTVPPCPICRAPLMDRPAIQMDNPFIQLQPELPTRSPRGVDVDHDLIERRPNRPFRPRRQNNIFFPQTTGYRYSPLGNEPLGRQPPVRLSPNNLRRRVHTFHHNRVALGNDFSVMTTAIYLQTGQTLVCSINATIIRHFALLTNLLLIKGIMEAFFQQKPEN